jgi:membrane protein
VSHDWQLLVATFRPLILISFLFAAIYKVLPDRDLEWRDVFVCAVVTGVLFTIGKSLISWYIGSSAVASSFGAAGALIVLLLWVYYSAQIFLLGAEFTKIFAEHHGNKQEWNRHEYHFFDRYRSS